MNRSLRLRFWLGLGLALIPCVGCTVSSASTPTSTSPPVPPQPALFSPPPAGMPTGEAGLVIKGRVHLPDGSGLAQVKIYRAFSAYPGEVVATTGEDGTYRSQFIFIYGDEMVSVWAELPGYQFEPEDWIDPYGNGATHRYWRHYYGYEEVEVNFRAIPDR